MWPPPLAGRGLAKTRALWEAGAEVVSLAPLIPGRAAAAFVCLLFTFELFGNYFDRQARPTSLTVGVSQKRLERTIMFLSILGWKVKSHGRTV